jgi:DNA-binding transcriptional regulator YdaS (Cro superfamily)
LSVSVSRVCNWRIRGTPAERCPDIERATNGAVRCEELRPEEAWSGLREAS